MTLTAVFAGDSVTEADRDGDPQGLGFGWVRLVAEALPGVIVRNAGVGGDRIVDLQRRWSDDVLIHAPELVSILVGVNDTRHRYLRGLPTTAVEFESTYRRLLDEAAAHGVESVILMEPFLVPINEALRRWRDDDLEAKVEVVRELATTYGARLVALDAAVLAACTVHGAGCIAGDGVHPSALGHRVIADAWLSAARPWLRARGLPAQ